MSITPFWWKGLLCFLTKLARGSERNEGEDEVLSWNWKSGRDSAEHKNTRLLCLIGLDSVLKCDIKLHLLLTRRQRQTVMRWRGREDGVGNEGMYRQREKGEGNKCILSKWIIRYSLKFYSHVARLLTNCVKLSQDCSLFWPRTLNL